MATREAMQLQQNVTVYESFGTSTLPSSMESPAGSPERGEAPPCRQRGETTHGEPEMGDGGCGGTSFPATCHQVVSRCLFLLLGVAAAWVEPSKWDNPQPVIYGDG